MMNIDGLIITNETELESAIANFDEDSKTAMRERFANEVPSPNFGSQPYNLIINPVKVKRYTSSNRSHLLIDYVSGLSIKLHRKSTLVKGECTKEEFFVNYNGTTYSDLVVKEEHVFTRDVLGFAIKKTTTITWFNEDGTESPDKKIWDKYYSNLEKIDEGKIRRNNLVNNLQMPCIGLISIAMLGTPNPNTAVILEGRRFLADYKTEFDNFASASDKTILACLTDSGHQHYISSSNYTWIDSMTPYGVTIRQFLISELTI